MEYVKAWLRLPKAYPIWTSPLCIVVHPPRVEFEEGTHWFPTGKLQVGGGASYKSWGPETYVLPARINPFHLLNQICFWVEFPWYFEKVPSFHVAFCCHHLIGIWYLHTKEPHIFGCFQKWWYPKMDGFYNGKPLLIHGWFGGISPTIFAKHPFQVSVFFFSWPLLGPQSWLPEFLLLSYRVT